MTDKKSRVDTAQLARLNDVIRAGGKRMDELENRGLDEERERQDIVEKYANAHRGRRAKCTDAQLVKEFERRKPRRGTIGKARRDWKRTLYKAIARKCGIKWTTVKNRITRFRRAQGKAK